MKTKLMLIFKRKKKTYEGDLIDKILIDLYEQGAFTFYRTPPDKFTGKASEELEADINEMSKSQYFEEEVKKIYDKLNEQVKAYIGAFNFLKNNEFIEQEEQEGYRTIFSLRLTLSGRAEAQSAISRELELKNKTSLIKASKRTVVLTLIIAAAAVATVLIATGVISFKKEAPQPIEVKVSPVINVDILTTETDTI